MAVLSLPYELRTRIYEAVFLDYVLRWKTEEEISRNTEQTNCPAVLHVSKQTYTECRPVMLKTALLDVTECFRHEFNRRIDGPAVPPIDLRLARHILYDRDKIGSKFIDFTATVQALPNLVSFTLGFGSNPCYRLYRFFTVGTHLSKGEIGLIERYPLCALGGLLYESDGAEEINEESVHKDAWKLIKAWRRRSCSFKLVVQFMVDVIDATELDPHFRRHARGYLDLTTMILKLIMVDDPSKTYEVKLNRRFSSAVDDDKSLSS